MEFDAIVIGAGNNGLSCARKLASAGARVAIFESSTFLVVPRAQKSFGQTTEFPQQVTC